jgi:hypothetical protein
VHALTWVVSSCAGSKKIPEPRGFWRSTIRPPALVTAGKTEFVKIDLTQPTSTASRHC